MANQAEQLEQLTAYLDGELSPAQRAEVDRLLAEDAGARALLLELQQTSQLVSALPRESAPESLADAVVNRMERRDLLGESPPHRATSSPVVSWSRRFAVAASIGLVGTAVWIAWPYLPQVVPKDEAERFVQMDEGQTSPNTPRLERQSRFNVGKTKSQRSPVRTPKGEAVVHGGTPEKAPLALGYIGDDADDEAPVTAEDDQPFTTFAQLATRGTDQIIASRSVEAPTPVRLESLGAQGERPSAKMEGYATRQTAADAPINPESVQPVTIETDANTIARLTTLFEEDMAHHGVPRVEVDVQAKGAARRDVFFTLQRAAPGSPASPPAGASLTPADTSGDEVRIVMCVPLGVAEQVLANMRGMSSEYDIAAGWMTGGRAVVPLRATGRSADHKKEKDLIAIADRDDSEEAPPDTDRLRGQSAVSVAEREDAIMKEGASFGDDELPTSKRVGGPLDEPPPTSQQNEPLVMLTIHLRTKPPAASPATTQPSTQPARLPTSQAAPRSTTTQEAPGG